MLPVDDVGGQRLECILFHAGLERVQGGDGLLDVAAGVIEGALDAAVFVDDGDDLAQAPVVQAFRDDGVLDQAPFVVRTVTESDQQGEGDLALAKIGALGLAELVVVGDVIQDVIGQLKGDAQASAVFAQGGDVFGRNVAQDAADGAGGGHQDRRLVGDDLQIILLGGGQVVGFGDFQDLAL